jgi:hypothetical protein
MRNREVLRQFQRIWMYMDVYGRILEYSNGIVIYVKSM